MFALSSGKLYTVHSAYIERCSAVQKSFNIEFVQYIDWVSRIIENLGGKKSVHYRACSISDVFNLRECTVRNF